MVSQIAGTVLAAKSKLVEKLNEYCSYKHNMLTEVDASDLRDSLQEILEVATRPPVTMDTEFTVREFIELFNRGDANLFDCLQMVDASTYDELKPGTIYLLQKEATKDE